MIVLGVANALRVVAELALGAPSGGFIGLPFLFAEGRAARALAASAAAPAPLVLVLPAPGRGMRDGLVARFGREGGRVFETDSSGVEQVVRRFEGGSGAPRGAATEERAQLAVEAL
ncbi:hypothetical protein BH18CHL2_BH18CHL2_09290 [soil metagenome]